MIRQCQEVWKWYCVVCVRMSCPYFYHLSRKSKISSPWCKIYAYVQSDWLHDAGANDFPFKVYFKIVYPIPNQLFISYLWWLWKYSRCVLSSMAQLTTDANSQWQANSLNTSQCNERSKQTASTIKHQSACARRHYSSSSSSAAPLALTLTDRRLPCTNSSVIDTMGSHVKGEKTQSPA